MTELIENKAQTVLKSLMNEDWYREEIGTRLGEQAAHDPALIEGLATHFAAVNVPYTLFDFESQRRDLKGGQTVHLLIEHGKDRETLYVDVIAAAPGANRYIGIARYGCAGGAIKVGDRIRFGREHVCAIGAIGALK